jgi:hypothetical protein
MLSPPTRVPEGKTLGFGPFMGWVPTPIELSDGTHLVTVIANDEDGADPDPPTVAVAVDRTLPTPPRMLASPPKASRDETPKFTYTATDERRLRDRYNDPFSAQLKRIRPPGVTIDNEIPFGRYLESRGPACPTPRRCTETSWPAYSVAEEDGNFPRFRGHLRPGLYEFRVRVSDIAGNKSPATRYRFRVLPSKRR